MFFYSWWAATILLILPFWPLDWVWLISFDQYPIFAGEEIMSQKAYGTCVSEVQDPLKFGVSREQANKISCFNRIFAEMWNSWESSSMKEDVLNSGAAEYTFYDSVTGKPLFIVPRGRTLDDFFAESAKHGWPSFRDDEVVWENVRSLVNGEVVSVDGTHLGHNLPDIWDNRYCINLVNIAGNPV